MHFSHVYYLSMYIKEHVHIFSLEILMPHNVELTLLLFPITPHNRLQIIQKKKNTHKVNLWQKFRNYSSFTLLPKLVQKYSCSSCTICSLFMLKKVLSNIQICCLAQNLYYKVSTNMLTCLLVGDSFSIIITCVQMAYIPLC